MPRTIVVIPFRDRGIDPYRIENCRYVARQWMEFGAATVISSDGRAGDAQFNRSAAYNNGARHRAADVIVYAESDMLIDFQQIRQAVTQAAETPGLVVPFTEYHYLSPSDSNDVRHGYIEPGQCAAQVRTGGTSVGAINVISRETLNLIGRWDERFEGSWYDDIAMHTAFEKCAGPTRWITGPAFHLYHLPGWDGAHLTEVDRAATQANKERLALYQSAESADRVRELMAGAA